MVIAGTDSQSRLTQQYRDETVLFCFVQSKKLYCDGAKEQVSVLYLEVLAIFIKKSVKSDKFTFFKFC